jgi:hypothetical protein
MATWKKVIVSGSNADLFKLNTGANQQITSDPTQTFLTGSFTGSFAGDGSNLTGVQATGISAATVTNIGNQGDFLFVSQSDGLKKITYQNFLIDLTDANDSNLEVDGSTDGIKLKANINVTQLTASVISASTYVGLPSFTTPASLTQGRGIEAFSFDGSTAATIKIKTGSNALADNVILKWDTGAEAFESSSLTDVNGVISGQSSIQLSGGSSSLTGSFTGSFAGDGSGLTGIGVTVSDNASGNVLLGTGTNSSLSGSAKLNYNYSSEILTVTKEIKFSASVANQTATFSSFANIITASIFAGAGSSPNTVLLGNPTSTTFIGNDLIINGDLIANGSSSFINTQNLLVSDRFITLASSSNINTDGGIIIQNSLSPAGTGSGFAFYLETATNAPRWSVTSSLNLNATSGTPDEYMVTAKLFAGTPSGNPTWGGTDGAGNIWIDTTGTQASDNNIWIYA